MYPILFKVGTFSIYSHGALVVLGIIIGAIIFYFLSKYEKLKTGYIFDTVIYAVLAGAVGARISYFMLYHDQFKTFKEFFYLWDGGMVSFGGFILGGLCFYFIFRYQKQPILKLFDQLAIAFPVGLFFGRLGNIAAGEYSGVLSSSRFTIEGRLPVTLFEAFWLIAIIIILILAKHLWQKTPEGIFFYFLLFLYGIGRFFIDIFRDENKILFSINLSQMVSLIVALFGIIMLLTIIYKKEEFRCFQMILLKSRKSFYNERN